MVVQLNFRKKRAKRLHVMISPRAKFNEIFAVLGEIKFSPPLETQENAMYAVLELVNNSLRAHRETNTLQPIRVIFQGSSEGLHIEVIDKGGGFDPSRLPYDLRDEVSGLDLNGDSFQNYRSIHNNTRFGMGLCIAKRFFHDFQLEFLSHDGEPREWGSKDIGGTRIGLFLKTGGTCVKTGKTTKPAREVLRETVLS
jgi:anti-sigma regulatory factor (Ser/Thr protein kinase)